MVIYTDLVEDLSHSLAEFQELLFIKPSKNDTVHTDLTKDAQIFSFVRAAQVVRSLLIVLHRENNLEFVPKDLEAIVMMLCMNEVIDEDTTDDLLQILDVSEFFTLDYAWLETEDDRLLFDGGVCQLPLFSRALQRLLQAINSKCELIERQESYEGH